MLCGIAVAPLKLHHPGCKVGSNISGIVFDPIEFAAGFDRMDNIVKESKEV